MLLNIFKPFKSDLEIIDLTENEPDTLDIIKNMPSPSRSTQNPTGTLKKSSLSRSTQSTITPHTLTKTPRDSVASNNGSDSSMTPRTCAITGLSNNNPSPTKSLTTPRQKQGTNLTRYSAFRLSTRPINAGSTSPRKSINTPSLGSEIGNSKVRSSLPGLGISRHQCLLEETEEHSNENCSHRDGSKLTARKNYLTPVA